MSCPIRPQAPSFMLAPPLRGNSPSDLLGSSRSCPPPPSSWEGRTFRQSKAEAVVKPPLVCPFLLAPRAPPSSASGNCLSCRCPPPCGQSRSRHLRGPPFGKVGPVPSAFPLWFPLNKGVLWVFFDYAFLPVRLFSCCGWPFFFRPRSSGEKN